MRAEGHFLVLADSVSAEGFADPAFWVNLGVAGIFLMGFATDRIHSKGSMDRAEASHSLSLDKLEKQHEAAMTKLERQNDRLIVERDRALAERDEMIEVMKNFTHAASGILQASNQQRSQSVRRRTGDLGQ